MIVIIEPDDDENNNNNNSKNKNVSTLQNSQVLNSKHYETQQQHQHQQQQITRTTTSLEQAAITTGTTTSLEQTAEGQQQNHSLSKEFQEENKRREQPDYRYLYDGDKSDSVFNLQQQQQQSLNRQQQQQKQSSIETETETKSDNVERRIELLLSSRRHKNHKTEGASRQQQQQQAAAMERETALTARQQEKTSRIQLPTTVETRVAVVSSQQQQHCTSCCCCSHHRTRFARAYRRRPVCGTSTAPSSSSWRVFQTPAVLAPVVVATAAAAAAPSSTTTSSSSIRSLLQAIRRDPSFSWVVSWQYQVVGWTLAGIVCGICFLFLLWVWNNNPGGKQESSSSSLHPQQQQQQRVLRAAQPSFLYGLCFGSIVFASAVIALSLFTIPSSSTTNNSVEYDFFYNESIHNNDTLCIITPWLFLVGYLITYYSLFSKLYRVYRVLQFTKQQEFSQQQLQQQQQRNNNNGSSNSNKKRNKRPPPPTSCKTTIPVSCFMVVAVVLLSVWTAIDPLHWELYNDDKPTTNNTSTTNNNNNSTSTTGMIVGYCSSEYLMEFSIALTVVALIPMFLTGRIAWKAVKDREAQEEDIYSENTAILVLIVVHIQCCLTGAPILYIARSPSIISTDSDRYLCLALVILFFPLATLALLLLPKVWLITRQCPTTTAAKKGGNGRRRSPKTNSSSTGQQGTNNDQQPASIYLNEHENIHGVGLYQQKHHHLMNGGGGATHSEIELGLKEHAVAAQRQNSLSSSGTTSDAMDTKKLSDRLQTYALTGKASGSAHDRHHRGGGAGGAAMAAKNIMDIAGDSRFAAATTTLAASAGGVEDSTNNNSDFPHNFVISVSRSGGEDSNDAGDISEMHEDDIVDLRVDSEDFF